MKQPILLLIAFFLHVGVGICGKLTELQVKSLEKSVVMINNIKTQQRGTGFIFKDKKYVITAYHVIAGSDGIVDIKYPLLNVTRHGKVIKTLKNDDLALIQITDPVEVLCLHISPKNPEYDESYTAIGFLWDAPQHFPKDLTCKGNNTIDKFVPSTVIKILKNDGCPETTCSVIALSGETLTPGYSGAPIFSNDGNIIGVGDGGIQDGIAMVSWGIPASDINDLMASASPARVGPSLSSHNNLYSADIIEFDDWKETALKVNGLTFYKVRKQLLSEFENTADDTLGLMRVLSYFPPQINKDSLEFDIYQNEDNGASFILPSGFDFQVENNCIVVYSSDKQAKLTLNFEHSSWYTVEGQTEILQNQQLTYNPPYTWTIDKYFTDMFPKPREDGFWVRRAGLYQCANLMVTIKYNNYLYECFAYKNNFLIYSSVTNKNYNTKNIKLSNACMVNDFSTPECKELLKIDTEWLKMALAVQFTTFSHELHKNP